MNIYVSSTTPTFWGRTCFFADFTVLASSFAFRTNSFLIDKKNTNRKQPLMRKISTDSAILPASLMVSAFKKYLHRRHVVRHNRQAQGQRTPHPK